MCIQLKISILLFEIRFASIINYSSDNEFLSYATKHYVVYMPKNTPVSEIIVV